jgi:hypothetical protein
MSLPMPLVLRVSLVSVILLLGACDAVVIDQPPGMLDATEIDGVWYVVEKDARPFFVRALPNGRLVLAGVEESGDGFEMEQIELQLMSIGDKLYISGLTDAESVQGYYFALVAETKEAEWVVFPPRIETFKAAVKVGELKGKLTEGRYATTVEVASEDVVEFLRKAAEDELWNDEEAIVVRKFTPMPGG